MHTKREINAESSGFGAKASINLYEVTCLSSLFPFKLSCSGPSLGGGGGGLCIFIYSGSARLVSFKIKLISKEVSQAEPEYMNIHPPNWRSSDGPVRISLQSLVPLYHS